MMLRFRLLSLCVAAACLGGCVPALIAGGTIKAGTGAAETRSVNAQLDDANIQVRLNAGFIEAGQDLFARIDTEVHEGRVLMTGVVPTPEARIAAAKVAWSTYGVREVYNELEVGEGTGYETTPQDLWIATQLRTRMVGQDSSIKNVNYNIEVLRGTVYLLGLAESEQERDLVISLARGVSGVKRVVDYTRLISDPRRSAPLPG